MRHRERKAMEEEQNKLHAVTKGFFREKSSNSEKPEEEMEMGRRKRKKKGQGLVKKK